MPESKQIGQKCALKEKPAKEDKAESSEPENQSGFQVDITKAYFVCGKAGYGKTTLIREFIAQIPPEVLWVFDYNCYDYAMLFNTDAHYWQNQTGTPEEAQLFIEAAYAKKDEPNDDKVEPYPGWTFVVLEEADNYLPRRLPGITRFVNTARNRAIGFMVSAKRSKSIPTIYRTRFDYLIVFHSTLPEDIEYIARWIGIYEDKEKYQSLANQMRNLKKGEYLFCDTNSGIVDGPCKLTLQLPDHNKAKNRPAGMTEAQAAEQ